MSNVTKKTIKATLACGCAVAFRHGVEGSPVTVVIETKPPTCTIPGHVGGLPVYDHREALRPSTRHLPPSQADWEEN